MTEHHRDELWYFDPQRGAFVHFRAGYYEAGVEQVPDLVLGMREARSLIPVLDAEGWITPRIDRQSREPDLHIIDELIKLAHANAKRKL